MRRSAGEIFAKGFLKSLLFFILFISIAVGSYKLFMHFCGFEDAGVIEAIPSVKKENTITEARIDVISKHLIFCEDETTGEIKKMLLEIYDCEKLMLNYITIPIKTQITLSDSLYRELILLKPATPQFLKLSAITGYLPREIVYDYGVLMIEELLNIKISYYSVLPESIYKTVFETETIKPQAYSQQNTQNTYPREIFSEEFLAHLRSIETESQLQDYIKELYTKMISNLSFEDKLNYMESYLKTPGENIGFDIIAGVDSNSAYTVDDYLATEQLKDYIGE